MIQIINKLFSSWNQNGIVYCSWKGNSHIDNAMRGLSDFDILIDKSSVNLGTELLKSAGFILCRPQN